mmetsp:Transcript_26762/g.63720  ORF Transcript_26762/g.63720 Transcript_26762/m.63720 type:complete len:228 (-) Transcript_26762:85-768(-)
MSCSMSGILREYCTVGAGLVRFRLSMRFTQLSISLGFFSAFSMDRTSMGCSSWFLLKERSCRSRMLGSEGFSVGSSKRVVPRPLGASSGRGIFRNASTSPMLGISSGMKGFRMVSSSMVWGLYLAMQLKSSSTSEETFIFLKSSGLYAPAGRLPDFLPPPSALDSDVEPSLLSDSPSLLSFSPPPPPDLAALPPDAAAAAGGAFGVPASDVPGVLTSSSVSTGMASS